MRVFVYGSLLSGLRNEDMIPASATRRRAHVRGSLYDTGHGFPVMYVEGASDGTVLGEAVEVDLATLARLDRLEHHPDMYRRMLVAATFEDTGETEDVWCYVRERPVARMDRIGSGDWKAYVEGRAK